MNMDNQIKPKKILITGGNGFVGRNIIELLKNDENFKIYNLSNKEITDIDNVKNIPCDATNFDFSTISQNFDYIIHLLALSNDKYCENFEIAEKVNITFTKSLLKFAKTQQSLKKFIHLSSIIIYDNQNVSPVKEEDKLYLNYTTYSFTKGMSELYANFYKEKFNLPILIFRLSNIYGPFQDFNNSPFLVPSKIIEGLKENKITVFSLEPRRDWIYSKDAAQAIIKALDSDILGIYNLASGKGISVQEIISEISKELKVKYESLNKPTTGPTDFYCNISKIKKDLNWGPTTTLQNGIKETIEYIKNNQKSRQ